MDDFVILLVITSFIAPLVIMQIQTAIENHKSYDLDEAVKALSLHTHKKAKMVKRDIYIQLKTGVDYTYLSIIDAEGKDVDLTLGELFDSRWILIKEQADEQKVENCHKE